ncbi:MAG: T9SS type A sorting domain-containing protein, partial [Ginsengibacter sp.]
YQSILQKKYTNNNPGPVTFEDRATDDVPNKGNNYYRLKITGQDGAVKYSSVQHLFISRNVFVTLEPNPVKANSEVKVLISGGEALRTNIDLYDFSGKRVFSQTFINNGLNRVEIKELPSGIYFYKIFYDQQVLNGKLVVAN